MRFWCAGSLVSCERNADSLKEKCGFVWTWLRTVRFFAGLNEGENICAVRYVVMKNVVGSTPCDHVNFSYTDIPTSIESLIDFLSVLSFFFFLVGYAILKDFLYPFGAKFSGRKFYW